MTYPGVPHCRSSGCHGPIELPPGLQRNVQRLVRVSSTYTAHGQGPVHILVGLKHNKLAVRSHVGARSVGFILHGEGCCSSTQIGHENAPAASALSPSKNLTSQPLFLQLPYRPGLNSNTNERSINLLFCTSLTPIQPH